MQDHKLLSLFDFNMESEQGALVAEINQCADKDGGKKGIDLSLISTLLEIKPLSNGTDEVILGSEEDFVKTYQDEIMVQRIELMKERDKRIERQREAERAINEKIKKAKQEEDEKMDQDFAKMLDNEAKAQAEKEKKEREAQQEKDDMCFKLAYELLDNDYDMAKLQLEQHNWNYQKVSDIIKKQKDDQRKAEEEKDQKVLKVVQALPGETDFDKIRNLLIVENWNADSLIAKLKREREEQQKQEQEQNMKVLQVVQQCEDVTDFDQIRASLIANNWNVQAVINQLKGQNNIHIMLVNCSNQSERIVLQFEKGKAYGNTIITQLLQIKPLNNSGVNAAYNIYRDAGKSQCLNYIMLSNRLEDLDLDRQPDGPASQGTNGLAPKILYFAQDVGMKWD